MRARPEFGGQRLERLAPGAGKRDRSPLSVQGARDGLTESARSAGDERGLSCQIEHQRVLSSNSQGCAEARKAAMSAGAPMLIVIALLSTIRLMRPVRTLP